MRPRDDNDFEQFVAARFAHLRRVAFVVVGDWQHAEDVVQAALVRVYLAWPRVKKKGSFEAYARRAVVNESISWARKPRREVIAETLPDTPEVAPSSGAADDLMQALAQLTPGQAAVIALRFLEDMSVKDVADLLGITEGTVKSQSAKGLAQLRQLVTPVPIEEH